MSTASEPRKRAPKGPERGTTRNGASLGSRVKGAPGTGKGPRTRFIADLLAMGWHPAKIYRRIEEEHERGEKGDVKARQIAELFTTPRGNLVSYSIVLMLYREIEDEFKKAFERDRDAWANQLKAMILDLYERALADKQLGAAGQCLDRLAKLEGLYTERVELSGPNGGPIQVDAAEHDLSALTDEELDEYERLNAKIFAKSRERAAAQLNIVGDAKVLPAGQRKDVFGDPGGEGET